MRKQGPSVMPLLNGSAAPGYIAERIEFFRWYGNICLSSPFTNLHRKVLLIKFFEK